MRSVCETLALIVGPALATLSADHYVHGTPGLSQLDGKDVYVLSA